MLWVLVKSQGTSNEYLQQTFSWRNKQHIILLQTKNLIKSYGIVSVPKK